MAKGVSAQLRCAWDGMFSVLVFFSQSANLCPLFCSYVAFEMEIQLAIEGSLL